MTKQCVDVGEPRGQLREGRGGEGGVREGGEGGRGRNRGRDKGRGFVVDLLVVYIFVSVYEPPYGSKEHINS